MALEESTEGLERLESNAVAAYIDPELKNHLVRYGVINIDYVSNTMGQSGYKIVLGYDDPCGSGKCSC
jgi:hypothetical protein